MKRLFEISLDAGLLGVITIIAKFIHYCRTFIALSDYGKKPEVNYEYSFYI